MRNRVSRLNSSLEQKKRTEGSDEEEKMIFTQTSAKPVLPQIHTPLVEPKGLKNAVSEQSNTYKAERRNYSNSFEVGESQGLGMSTQSMRKLVNLDATPENTRYGKIPTEQGLSSSLAKQSERYERVMQRRRKYYPRLEELHRRRNKSQMEEYTGDSEQQSLFKRQKATQRTNKLSRSENSISANYEHASFQELWRTVPRELKDRNQENLRLFAYRCHKISTLMKKLEYVTVVELLKTCTVAVYDKNQVVYSRDKKATCSYIILWGKIAVIDSKTRMENIYETGQTLHEDYLLEYRRYQLKTLNETAIAVQNTGLLQLNHKTLVLIKSQLMQISLRSDLINLEAQFRKNYLTKLNLRATMRSRHKRSKTVADR